MAEQLGKMEDLFQIKSTKCSLWSVTEYIMYIMLISAARFKKIREIICSTFKL